MSLEDSCITKSWSQASDPPRKSKGVIEVQKATTACSKITSGTNRYSRAVPPSQSPEYGMPELCIHQWFMSNWYLRNSLMWISYESIFPWIGLENKKEWSMHRLTGRDVTHFFHHKLSRITKWPKILELNSWKSDITSKANFSTVSQVCTSAI